jgi:hypothetical protein
MFGDTDLLADMCGAFDLSIEHRQKDISELIGSSHVVIISVGESGHAIKRIEGQGLSELGVAPGSMEGASLAGSFPFLSQMLKDHAKNLSLTNPAIRSVIPYLCPDQARKGPWLVTISYKRSASGRPTGIVFLALPLYNTVTVAGIPSCPFGSCVIGGGNESTSDCATGCSSPAKNAGQRARH